MSEATDDGDEDVVPSTFLCASVWVSSNPTTVLLLDGNGDRCQRRTGCYSSAEVADDGDKDVVSLTFICACVWVLGNPATVLLHGGDDNKL